MREFYVYILFNHSRTLYVGMTNDLIRRMEEHRGGRVPGFAAKYKINRLAYYETFPTASAAIECEKRIKGWTRAKKIALIEGGNPHWEDLGNGLEERVAPAEGAAAFGVRGEILRCAQDDVVGENVGAFVRGKVLRCAQDDVVGETAGAGARGQVLRCAQDDVGGGEQQGYFQGNPKL